MCTLCYTTERIHFVRKYSLFRRINSSDFHLFLDIQLLYTSNQHANVLHGHIMGSKYSSACFALWIVYLVTVLFCSTLTEAQTAVGFQFKEDYSTIGKNVEAFTRALQTDLREVFINTSELSSTEITSSPNMRIQVNFTLTIDTTITAKVQARKHLHQTLLMGDYEFAFGNNTHMVDGSTVWVVNSFQDIWHQYAPEIVIAIICGLAALAIFVVSIQLLCMNRKHQKRRSTIPMSYSGNSLGHAHTNGGFMMEESNPVYSPKSSIGSTRFFSGRDTLYDKLIYGAYEVPRKHMFEFL